MLSRKTAVLAIAAALCLSLPASSMAASGKSADSTPVISVAPADRAKVAELLRDAEEARSRKSYVEASVLYRKAADLGSAIAYNNLGELFESGQGMKRSTQNAEFCYRKAAATGLHEAEYNLARLYDYGVGVRADYSKAAYWYRKAADGGFTPAVSMLGEIGRAHV